MCKGGEEIGGEEIMCNALPSKHDLGVSSFQNYRLGARFSKAPESFRALKAVFRSPVSKNGELYMPETSCMKGTFLHL